MPKIPLRIQITTRWDYPSQHHSKELETSWNYPVPTPSCITRASEKEVEKYRAYEG